jgi:hypothetical protein
MNNAKHSTQLSYLGYAYFVFLGLLATYFYLERSTMTDAAYQIFSIIITEDYAIQVNRFGAVFTQTFPLLALKFQLPLQQILLCYSLAFILYPLLLYWILQRWARQDNWAISIPLFAVLMVSHTFYWIQSELIQGCFFLLFYFACLNQKSALRSSSIPFYLTGLIIILFFHPLMFIPLLYLWLFGLHSSLKTNRIYWSIPLVMALILILKHWILPANVYDLAAISHSQKLFDEWWDFFSFISTKRFLVSCLKAYYLFTLLFLVLVYYYAASRQFTKGILLIGFSFAYIFLVNSTFRWGLPKFHMESFNQILAIFVLVPFLLDLFPKFSPKTKVLFLTVVLVIRLVHIYSQHSDYSKRLAWNQTVLQNSQQLQKQKFLLPENVTPMDLLQITWASPYETLLLSTLSGPDSCKSIFIFNPDIHPVEKWLPANNSLVTPFGPIPLESLPTQYFHFESNSAYEDFPQYLMPGTSNDTE